MHMRLEPGSALRARDSFQKLRFPILAYLPMEKIGGEGSGAGGARQKNTPVSDSP